MDNKTLRRWPLCSCQYVLERVTSGLASLQQEASSVSHLHSRTQINCHCHEEICSNLWVELSLQSWELSLQTYLLICWPPLDSPISKACVAAVKQRWSTALLSYVQQQFFGQRERKLHDNFASGNESYMLLSLPGANVPESESSREQKFQREFRDLQFSILKNNNN